MWRQQKPATRLSCVGHKVWNKVVEEKSLPQMASELWALCKDDREKLHEARILIQIPPDHALAIKADLVPGHVPHHLATCKQGVLNSPYLSLKKWN